MSNNDLEYEKIICKENSSPFLYNQKTIPNPKDTYKMHWHEQLEIKYVISGKIIVNCDTNVIYAEEGDIIIANSFERHLTEKVEHESGTYNLLCVDLSNFLTDTLLKSYFLPYINGVYRFKNLIRDERLRIIICEIFDALSSDRENRILQAIGLFITFFSELQNDYIDKDYVRTEKYRINKRSEDIVNTTLKYIYAHYNENISLKTVANQCYITVEHLGRVFKQVTGKTPTAYISEFRINKAAMMLRHSQMSIKEIASSVGFTDYAYFFRCFKKYNKMTPLAYIKSIEE